MVLKLWAIVVTKTRVLEIGRCSMLNNKRNSEKRSRSPPPDGGMWNSPKVGEWIERRTGKVLTQKKQRGWEYMRRLGNSPKVPRPRHKKANKHEQEAFKKSSR